MLKTSRKALQIRFGIFLSLAIGIILIAIFSPVIATHNPLQSVLSDARQPASSEHIFGTDLLGRDLYSRIIYGTRTSIFAALALVAAVFTLGITLGITAGYSGKVVDSIIMRIADAMLAFPDFILALAIVGVLGPSMMNAMIALVAVGWTKYARLARSLVLKIRYSDYILAAEVSGGSKASILLKHMLPNCLPTLIVNMATDIGSIILSLASLSFLGCGVQPPTPEWGYMLSEARSEFLSCPWLLFYPAMAIFITVVVFNLLGDSLRDLLDPKGAEMKF